MIHELKTWPEPFAALLEGRKMFEIRKADRPFDVGDALDLREWNPDGSGYTGRETVAVVTYIVRGGAWGLPPDLCVMGLGFVPEVRSHPARSAPRAPLCPGCAVRSPWEHQCRGGSCPCPECAPAPAAPEE
jgi:hypothetical protein